MLFLLFAYGKMEANKGCGKEPQKGGNMYNKFLGEREINVKVGDLVAVSGNRGHVTEVIKGIKYD